MKNSALPCGQTPIRKPAASTISTTSKAKTAPSGSSLPSRISSVLAGVSWSCSKVPAEALVHDRDGGDQRGEEREHEAEGARRP